MKKTIAIKEYAKILKKYMKAFSLEAIDIAYLAKSVKRTVSSVLEEKGSLELETLEAIAGIFGLRYFEFGNPAHPLPASTALPDATKARIEYRKKEGPAKETSYSASDINERITQVLSSYEVGEQFLAEEIANTILKKHEENYTVSEIIDRFKKTFKNNIEKTDQKDVTRKGRGPKPVFYRLVSVIKN
ncbi:MAG: hypothetical protein ABIP95_16730 [Pelobium sp.]